MNKKYDLIELSSIAAMTARKAGDVILSFYKNDIETVIKNDGSPFTKADKAAHETIVSLLAETGIPIVSEEAKEVFFESEYYWLVDPLDGTKDFLDENDEFTVNIGLIQGNKPILGVVFAPALDEIYIGAKGLLIQKKINGVNIDFKKKEKSTSMLMATSRFHNNNEAAVFAVQNGISILKPVGSALKLGRMAFGEVDVYPRFVGTSEWDTAAGQAVLEAAGGSILDLDTFLPLIYGKTERRNGNFIAFRLPYCIEDFTVEIEHF